MFLGVNATQIHNGNQGNRLPETDVIKGDAFLK